MRARSRPVPDGRERAAALSRHTLVRSGPPRIDRQASAEGSAAATAGASAAGASARTWTVALTLVALWYTVAQFLSLEFLQAAPQPGAWPRDLAAHLLIGALMFAAARGLWRYALAMVFVFSAFTLANGLKIAILGAPIMPDDFTAATNLFLLLDGWQLAGAVALVALPLVLLAWMFDWRSGRAWLVTAGAAAGVALAAAAPAKPTEWLDRSFGDWVWNQRGNYEARGLPIHLVQESLRRATRTASPPGVLEVRGALETLRADPRAGFRNTSGDLPSGRNVHMIVLESFWDPGLLVGAGLSEDPLDPEFRQLWAATRYSHALSPVFGGYTANAEFEALCGFPITQDAVFFEGHLRRDVPCLPRHLEGAGYLSFASHPNVAPFWNRVHAYRRVGFSTYWSAKDFDLDDLNGEFLSDASLFRQVLDRLAPALAGPAPLFNYVLTFFGHLDYPLNERRPPVVVAANGDAEVEAYANTVYYKSREVMAFVRELRERDPDAIIVLFGDHLPSLGLNFSAYVDSGLLRSDRADFEDEMFRTLVATPLLVLDGRRGPLALGDLPIYELPALILDLLGDSRDSILRLAVRGPLEARIRPLPGIRFLVHDGTTQVCRAAEDDDACVRSAGWLEAIDVLERDLFGGDQRALDPIMPWPRRHHTVVADEEFVSDEAGEILPN